MFRGKQRVSHGDAVVVHGFHFILCVRLTKLRGKSFQCRPLRAFRRVGVPDGEGGRALGGAAVIMAADDFGNGDNTEHDGGDGYHRDGCDEDGLFLWPTFAVGVCVRRGENGEKPDYIANMQCLVGAL